MKKDKENDNRYFDELWKEVIESLFRNFLFLFMPELEAMVDFNRDHIFLDKELQKISLPLRKGKKFVDKLVKVYLKNGEEKWILIHIEVQGQSDADFNERMFVYFYRIFDKYEVKIVSLAVITYPAAGTFEYRYEFFNTKVLYQYNVSKIEEKKEEELLASSNPFALVCLAVKYSNAAKDDKDLRYKFKSKLIRLMYKKGSGREEILALFEFIDGALDLDDKVLDTKITEEIEQIEEKEAMPYVTSVERIGIEKGIEKGKKEGIEKGELIGDIRFIQLMKGLPISDKKELEELSIDDLKKKLEEINLLKR